MILSSLMMTVALGMGGPRPGMRRLAVMPCGAGSSYDELSWLVTAVMVAGLGGALDFYI